MTAPRFYIIAGEPSGDRLGGALMESLQDLSDAQFAGIGGRDMIAAGLSSLFEMAELSVMGISEILPRLPNLLRRIRQTSEDIVRYHPDALITIDSPDFTLRVAARVRRVLPDLKVAPSVWAWRPGRAKKMARSVDHVLALLPFEPPYMQAAGMTCDFVGHPVAGRPMPDLADVAAFRIAKGITEDQKALLLAPGSRRGEVRRLRSDFVAVVGRLRERFPDLTVLCPIVEAAHDEVIPMLDAIGGEWWGVHASPESPESGEDPKALAFAAADAALCASGTVTLELAAVGTPMVTAYKTTWLTAAIVRRVVRVNTANLINLVSGQAAVPELLQEFCTVDALEQALVPLLADPEAAEKQRRVFADVMQIMGRGGEPPEARAAESVLAFLRGDASLPDQADAIMEDILPGPKDRHIGRTG